MGLLYKVPLARKMSPMAERRKNMNAAVTRFFMFSCIIFMNNEVHRNMLVKN